MQPEERFRDEPVHPTGGAGVPGPPAAANVGRDGVDVGRHHVRLDAITGERLGGVAVVTGLISPKSSQARRESPMAAKAITVQTAAWVYWPPFSRNAGDVPLMYPG